MFNIEIKVRIELANLLRCDRKADRVITDSIIVVKPLRGHFGSCGNINDVRSCYSFTTLFNNIGEILLRI